MWCPARQLRKREKREKETVTTIISSSIEHSLRHVWYVLVRYDMHVYYIHIPLSISHKIYHFLIYNIYLSKSPACSSSTTPHNEHTHISMDSRLCSDASSDYPGYFRQYPFVHSFTLYFSIYNLVVLAMVFCCFCCCSSRYLVLQNSIEGWIGVRCWWALPHRRMHTATDANMRISIQRGWTGKIGWPWQQQNMKKKKQQTVCVHVQRHIARNVQKSCLLFIMIITTTTSQ